ncbi:hypothetical protein CFOL_v3_36394, partial [Cephalotus follicularis]
RKSLWADLIHCANRFRNVPWLVLGDFNVTRYGKEHSSNGIITKAMTDFNMALVSAELDDLASSGLYYTWSNRRAGDGAVSKKLERALGNWHWFLGWGDTYATSHPPGISDHSPITVQLRSIQFHSGRPFKFLNYWTKSEKFLLILKHEWRRAFPGSPLIVLHGKLKSIKSLLKDLDPRLVEQERQLRAEVVRAACEEEEFYKQKSRVQWLKEGD